MCTVQVCEALRSKLTHVRQELQEQQNIAAETQLECVALQAKVRAAREAQQAAESVQQAVLAAHSQHDDAQVATLHKVQRKVQQSDKRLAELALDRDVQLGLLKAR